MWRRSLNTRYLSRDRTWVLTQVIALVGCLIVMAEIDRLIGSSYTAAGRSMLVSDVSGPLALTKQDAWGIWADTLGGSAAVAGWIRVHTLFDLLFILTYWRLLRRFARGIYPADRGARRYRRFLALVVLADLAEDALILLTTYVPGFDLPALHLGIAVAATVTWAAVALGIGSILSSRLVGGRVLRWLSTVVQTLFVHRLAFFALSAIALLALVPSGNIFDQLPDVERGWLDPGGTPHLVSAVLATLLVASLLWLLGRQRSERAWNRFVRRILPQGKPLIGWWLAGPAIAGLLAAILGANGAGDLVYGPSLGAFVAVPIGLLLLSLLVGFGWPATVSQPGRSRQRLAIAMIVTGDNLAVLFAAVGSLGLVRSFAAPFFLAGTRYNVLDERAGLFSSILFWGGLITAVAAPFIARAVIDRIDARISTAGPSTAEVSAGPVGTPNRRARLGRFVALCLEPERRTRWQSPQPIVLDVVLAAIAGGLLALMMLFPRVFADSFGIVAVAVGAIGLWSLFIGVIIVDLQRRRPLALFQRLGFRADPVLTLLVAVPLLIGLGGGAPGLHGIRTVATPVPGSSSSTPAARATAGAEAEIDRADAYVAAALKNWEDTSTACEITAGGTSQSVRPLLVVGVEGGGIRAAFWTAKVMQTINALDPCVRDSVLLSSGISGGSLGLVLSRQYRTLAASSIEKFRDPDQALPRTLLDRKLDALADPSALAAAVTGLLVGDNVAGVTGIRVNSFQDETWAWRDRAALMEQSWERGADRLDGVFSPAIAGPAGALIINSTDAVSGCRVSITQMPPSADPLESEATAANDSAPLTAAACGSYEGSAASIGFEVATSGSACPAQLRWSTVAMLSARFPIVTPAGRLPVDGSACAAANEMQLIDGGYAEPSGLNALSDFTPSVAREISRLNATATGRPEAPFTVPLLLYVRNSTGIDSAIPVEDLSSETLVPIAGLKAKDLQNSPEAWIQRISADLANGCAGAVASCSTSADAMYAVTGGSTVVIAPGTYPSVEPPLGWTLSTFSRQNLTQALQEQREDAPTDDDGIGRLSQLMDLGQ
jgi:hypothetical protein